MTDKVISILFSLPVILVVLYFIPFLGVLLLIAKFIMQKGWVLIDKYTKSMLFITSLGIILFVPKAVSAVISKIKTENLIFPVLDTIMKSDIYPKLMIYGKRLITVGVVMLIVGYVIRKIYLALSNKIMEAMNKHFETQREVFKENDMKIREKQERAKNFHVVKCSHCGGLNKLTESTGKCKYCRNAIEYKEKA